MGSSLNDIPLLGSMFGGQPKQSIENIDPETLALMDKDVSRVANQTDSDVYNNLTAGVDRNAHAFDKSDAQVGQEAARTGQDPAMLQAIRNQYSQKTNNAIQSLKSQAGVQAKVSRGQQMSDFAKTAIAKQQVSTQNFEALSQAYQASEQARGQMLSSLINLGSTANTINNANNSAGGGSRSAYSDFNSGSNGMPGTNRSDYTGLS